VRIGGEGGGSATYDAGTSAFTQIPVADITAGKAGGYNGGGNGGNTVQNIQGASGGGGATDVRLLADSYQHGTNDRANGTNDDGTSGLDTWETRIIVAAGGGGASMSRRNNAGHKGGNAEENGNYRNDVNSQTYVICHGGTDPAIEPNANTTGNAVGVGGNGRDGQFTQAAQSAFEGAGGGGGGYRGGEALLAEIPSGSGAGGGNYIAAGFTDTETGLNEVFGSGKAVLKWVGPSPD
jgi:hypothetical protein